MKVLVGADQTGSTQGPHDKAHAPGLLTGVNPLPLKQYLVPGRYPLLVPCTFIVRGEIFSCVLLSIQLFSKHNRTHTTIDLNVDAVQPTTRRVSH